mmetsp:Transcript_20776/g.47883  ORF Transcript_20776/g.47883 Transcript_20776/m.47883 type:complete len:213 (-) Transcript_20776:563-1201(-)
MRMLGPKQPSRIAPPHASHQHPPRAPHPMRSHRKWHANKHALLMSAPLAIGRSGGSAQADVHVLRAAVARKRLVKAAPREQAPARRAPGRRHGSGLHEGGRLVALPTHCLLIGAPIRLDVATPWTRRLRSTRGLTGRRARAPEHQVGCRCPRWKCVARCRFEACKHAHRPSGHRPDRCARREKSRRAAKAIDVGVSGLRHEPLEGCLSVSKQ